MINLGPLSLADSWWEWIRRFIFSDLFPDIFVVESRNHFQYLKRDVDQICFEKIIKYWIFDLRILILDSQNGLE